MKKTSLLTFFFFVITFQVGIGSLNNLPSPVVLANEARVEEERFLVFDKYTPPSLIKDIAFEGNYIWAATVDGVVRWNKLDHTFVEYSTDDGLADSAVLSILVDNNGHKWFGTQNGGVSRFDGSNWVTFSTQNGLVDNSVYVIFQHPNGNILFGTGQGLSMFDGSSWSYFPLGPTTQISAIAVDLSQNLWVGTYYSGTYKLSGSNWTYYSSHSNGPGGSVRDIIVDDVGNIWFAFHNHQYGAVGRFSGPNWTRFDKSDGLVGNYADTIEVDANGNIWVGFTDGLGKFNGATWSKFDMTQEIGSPDYLGVQKIRSDHNNQMWFASDERLLTLDGLNWDIYLAGLPIPSLLGPPYIGADQNDDIWFSVVRSGVVKYDGSTWQMYTTADGLGSWAIQKIIADHSGNTWFAAHPHHPDAPKGVSRFDGTSWANFTQSDGLASDVVYDMGVDSNGNVWFGTLNGLSMFDGTNWTTYTTSDGLLDNRIHSIAVNGTDVWFGYYKFAEYGVTHFDGTNWTNHTTSDGLPSAVIFAIDVDELGNPWVATKAGVSYFNGSEWLNYSLTNISYINDLIIDAYDNVWIGLYDSNDVSRLSRLTNGVWRHFTTADGLYSNSVSSFAHNSTREEIWLSHGSAVVRMRQLLLKDNVYLPMIISQ